MSSNPPSASPRTPNPTRPSVTTRSSQQTIQDQSSRRQSIPTRPNRRRTSTSTSAASIGGTLDTAGPNTIGQVNEYSQNAISALLSPPIVRTGLVPHTSLPASSSHRPPTARDIPAVTLTSIPHVESSAFRPYLAQVGPLFDNFQRAKAASEESQQQLPRSAKASTRDDEFSETFGRYLRKDSLPPASPAATPKRSSIRSPPDSPTSVRSPGTPRPRHGPSSVTPLSTVPNVYFEENFKLENPRIFDVVSEYADIIPPDRPGTRDGDSDAAGIPKSPVPQRGKALHTNAILQEKLSWYMDTVEVHLISSIATASSSFFAALKSLKELEAEATDSIREIKNLRSALQNLDSQMAVGGLEIVKMRRKRDNIRKLGQAVDQLCEIVDETKQCEELVKEGEVEEATARIDSLEDLIEGKPPKANDHATKPPRIDLRQLKALEGISDGISGLRSRVGKGFEARFIDALLSDLRDHVQTAPSQETLERWANASLRSRSDHQRKISSDPAYLRTNSKLRPGLLSALVGLSQARYTTRAATAYRETVMREIKSMIRQNLPSSNDDDAESVTSMSTTKGGRRLNQQEKSAILARNLRALDIDGAEDLLIKVYTAVGEALRRLGFQVKVLLDVTSSMEPPTARQSIERTSEDSQDKSAHQDQIRAEVSQALDLSSLLGQAVDVVQGQITKVLKVRADQSTRLPLERFLRYFILNRLFADECEAVSSRSGDTLKEVVNAHIKDFLNNMAESEKMQISQTLDSERWDAKDFGRSENTLLDRVVESMTKTPTLWSSYTALWNLPASDNLADQPSHVNGDDTPAATKTQIRSAQLDTQRYLLVQSVHALLTGISHFMHLVAVIPALAPDASTRLLDYLKLFNSRACQLILGAGATKSAGLKNITTKHLALASQACSFVVSLMPYVREFVRRHLPSGSGNVLAEFDRVKRLFHDHQTSIHEKLVDIMAARSTSHIGGMRKVDYDGLGAKADISNSPPSQWVEILAKETGTLHRVLARHVSEVDLKMIMTPIFEAYRDDWGKALKQLGDEKVKTEGGKSKLLRDVSALESHLAKLDPVGADVGATLVTAVSVSSKTKESRTKEIPGQSTKDRLSNDEVRASQETTLNSTEKPESRNSNDISNTKGKQHDSAPDETSEPQEKPAQPKSNGDNEAEPEPESEKAKKGSDEITTNPVAKVDEEDGIALDGAAITAETNGNVNESDDGDDQDESKSVKERKSSVDIMGSGGRRKSGGSESLKEKKEAKGKRKKRDKG